MACKAKHVRPGGHDMVWCRCESGEVNGWMGLRWTYEPRMGSPVHVDDVDRYLSYGKPYDGYMLLVDSCSSFVTNLNDD